MKAMRNCLMFVFNMHLKIQCKLASVFLFILCCSLSLFSQTVSAKRGVAGDMLGNADCVTSDSLTWYYNWANTPSAPVINTHQNYIEFCPMLWNGTWNATNLNNYLNAHPEVKYLLAFNEPNFADQANMTVAQAVALWPQVVAIADAHNLKIVSPAMSYCPGNCLPGYTNLHGTKWLDDFFAACPTCRVDYIGLHIYDTWYHGFRGVMNLYKKYNRPIWVTEFDYSGATLPVQHASLMVDVIDLMENDPTIMRYAWFMTRYAPGHSTNLYQPTTGVLTDLGKIYHYMSTYDNTFFHPVNAIIEAEHYIDKSVIYCIWNGTDCTWPYSVLLEPTTDVSGKLQAYHFASPVAHANDTLFYNIDIPTTQNYSIDFRVNSTANSTFAVRTYPGNVLLGTTASLNTGGTWATRTLTGVNLSAGKQRIYLTASNGAPLKLNWLRINCASSCGSLPVELIRFHAYASVQGKAQLEWETAAEKDNLHFIVEKSSDGIVFQEAGTVPAQAGHSGITYYEFTDDEWLPSLTYYRLKQIDTDGNFSYSSIEVINTQQDKIDWHVNSIVSTLSSAEDIHYTLTSPSGQLLEQGTYQAGAGTTEKKLALKKLSSGVYLLKVASQNVVYSTKIFIHD